MNHGLLLFFNHPYRKVRVFLEQFYRDRFTRIHVLTPPENAEPNRSENVTYYYNGSYNFGGAFSYLLNRSDIFQGMDWVTVLHDDVVPNPAFPGTIDADLVDRPDSFSPLSDLLHDYGDWLWYPRMVARTFCHKQSILGDGNESALAELKALYARAQGLKDQKTQLKILFTHVFHPGAKGALARQMLWTRRSLRADFGVPLYLGNSDFFTVRQDRFNEFCHSAGALSRAGIFAEVAVPTALRWLGEHPKIIPAERLDWNYEKFEEHTRPFQITDLNGIQAYFDRFPGRLAIHPIKMSKLLSS